MPKFKKGDRVVVVNLNDNDGTIYGVGFTGVVIVDDDELGGVSLWPNSVLVYFDEGLTTCNHEWWRDYPWLNDGKYDRRVFRVDTSELKLDDGPTAIFI